MSKYTTEVRYICEEKAGLTESVGSNSVNDILNLSWDKIFDSEFPIFDENYRKPLCMKILKHYYTREICCETFGLWKLWLNEKMELIMPYYNQLYEDALKEIDPFQNFNYTESGNDTKNSDTDVTEARTGEMTEGVTGQVAEAGNSWDKYSDTPQGTLQNLDNSTYLTNARNITDTNNTSSNTNTTRSTNNTRNTKTDFDTTSQYIKHMVGMRGVVSVPRLIKEFRETFLNIDELIIEELVDLFFKLW